MLAHRTALLILALGLSACNGGDGGDAPTPPPDETTLRDLAQGRILVGAAVAIDPLRNDSAYGSLLGAQYDLLVAENAMKFGLIEPSRGTFFWDDADAIVDFAGQHAMAVRGHALVWHSQAGWLSPDGVNLAPGVSAADLPGILENHVRTVVGRYAGKVAYWDVVNEVIADGLAPGLNVEAALRPSFWARSYPGASKLQFIEDAFRWAHAADPAARLFYNEYGAEGSNSTKSEYAYALAKRLLDDGVPIHGVGLQMHVDDSGYPLDDGFAAQVKRFTDLGLQVQITEADVRLAVDGAGAASPADLQAQAGVYHDLLAACLQNPKVTAFLTWGLDDGHSWIPRFFAGYGAALPFDASYAPKPAFYALRQALGGP